MALTNSGKDYLLGRLETQVKRMKPYGIVRDFDEDLENGPITISQTLDAGTHYNVAGSSNGDSPFNIIDFTLNTSLHNLQLTLLPIESRQFSIIDPSQASGFPFASTLVQGISFHNISGTELFSEDFSAGDLSFSGAGTLTVTSTTFSLT